MQVTTAAIFLLMASTEANLLRPIGTQRARSNLIQSTKDQYNFLPPINLPEGVVESEPVPTNVWWGNLIHVDPKTKSHPIYMNPYTIDMELDAAPFGIQILYSHQYKGTGPINENGAIKHYTHGIGIKDLVLSAHEFQTTPKVRVIDWDEFGFGVTAEMSNEEGKLASNLIMGSAFVNARYTSLRPAISTEHAIESVNNQAVGTTITGQKFILKLNNGQTWAIYTDSPVSLTSSSSQLLASTVFTGMMRAALLSGDNPNEYDPYAACVLTGGHLEVPNANEYSIKWDTEGDCRNGALHFALPHQLESLDRRNLRQVDIKLHTTTRGQVEAFRTLSTPAQWTFKEPEQVNIGFYPPRKASQATLQEYNVLELLQEDIEAPWDLPKRGSYYFTGKNAQKYASLCLMAADESLVGNDVALKQVCIKKLQDLYHHFLENSWEYPLVYDEVYRGVCSSEAFVRNDQWSDFGNSAYNDHHFHWGYWITASAILKHLDPTWTRMAELDEMINLLIRDVANPTTEDPWFPTFRHFDWFAGHSYSHGISPFADGKDQESTSEEMNFHYGLMLWGKASGNVQLEELGKLMIKVNKRAINTYFLMTDDNTVHPPEFIKNKVAGIFFDNKVDYATWFCGQRECIHGIQMIPVSPINEMYRTETFIREEWEQVLSKLDITTNDDLQSPWQSLIYANVATIDKKLALDKLRTVPLDSGLSRSWALYYAATRPGPDATPPVVTPAPSVIPTPVPSVVTPMPTPVPSVTTPTPSPSVMDPIPTPVPSRGSDYQQREQPAEEPKTLPGKSTAPSKVTPPSALYSHASIQKYNSLLGLFGIVMLFL